MDTDCSEEFYVLYCCRNCHAQFKNKDTLIQHRTMCRLKHQNIETSQLIENDNLFTPEQSASPTCKASPNKDNQETTGSLPHLDTLLDTSIDKRSREPGNALTGSLLCRSVGNNTLNKAGTMQDTGIFDIEENMEGLCKSDKTKIFKCTGDVATRTAVVTIKKEPQLPQKSESFEKVTKDSEIIQRKRGRPKKDVDVLNTSSSSQRKQIVDSVCESKVYEKSSEGIMMSAKNDNQNVRKSRRIMAKPRMSYAKLAKLHHDSDKESDSDEMLSIENTQISPVKTSVRNFSEGAGEMKIEAPSTTKLSRQNQRIDVKLEKHEKLLQQKSTSKYTGVKSRADIIIEKRKKFEKNLGHQKKKKAKATQAKRKIEGKITEKSCKNEVKDTDEECVLEKTEKCLKKQKSSKTKEVFEKLDVNLQDHKDMFVLEEFESIAPMDRGKTKEEKTYKRYSCKICNSYKTPNVESFESHLGLHLAKRLTCNECDFIAGTPGLLSVHIKEYHNEGHDPVVCELCGCEFGEIKRYRDHMGSLHGVPSFSCKKCRQKFLSHKELKEHRLADHSNAAFRCESCGLIFLSQHYYDKHTESKACFKDPIQCEFCGSFKKTRSQLQEHVRRVHTKEHTFSCKYCSYSASQSYLVRDHMRAHEGIRPHKCDQCQFSCVKAWQLVSHKRTHTGEKSYRCDQCNYAAAWKVQIRNHKKSHQSASQESCKLCNITFKDARCLALHQNKVHPDVYPKALAANALKGDDSKLRNLLQVREVEGTNIILCEQMDSDENHERSEDSQNYFMLNDFKFEQRHSGRNDASYVASWVDGETDMSGQPTEDQQTCFVRAMDSPDQVQ